MSQIINRSELLGLFMETHKASIASVQYISDARVRKTANPHPLVTKKSKINCVLNYNYSKALAKRLANLGQDPSSAKQVHDRNWGSSIKGTPLIEYIGKDGVNRHYLNCMILKSVETTYSDTTTGKELSYEEVKKFLPNRDPSALKVANISLENIKGVKIGGVAYEVQ